MTTETTETTAVETTETTETTGVVEYEKGTWQYDLQRGAKALANSETTRKRASSLLWSAAVAGITEWADDNDDDKSAEGLYDEVMEALGGKSRKGDASKIKSVALAVEHHGLDLDEFPNLSKAWSAARALMTTAPTEDAEDEAAEEVIAKMAEDAPKTATTPEGAAKIVLSKGVDEAARVLIDALGDSPEAHRALARAISNEIAGRVSAKREAEQAEKQAEREKIAAEKAAEREKIAAEKAAEREAKAAERAKAQAERKATAAPKKAATPAKKAAPVKPESVSKGDPNKRAMPRAGVKRAVPAKG